MDKILLKIDQNSSDIITYDEFTKLIEEIRQEDMVSAKTIDEPISEPIKIPADSGIDITDDIASEISSSNKDNLVDKDEEIVTEPPKSDSFDSSSSLSSKMDGVT